MGSLSALPALDLKTPQQPNLLEQYSQLQQLKGSQQLQQIRAQQAPLQQQQLEQGVQTGKIDLQQAQQGQQDQQAFRAATQDPSMQGKTIGQIAQALAAKGQISPQGYATAQKADLDHQETLQKLDTGALANAAAAHKQTQALYDNIMNMPDDQLAAQWPQIAQQVNAIPGNKQTQLNPQQPMTKQQLSQFGPMISMGNSYLDQELARRKAQADLAETLSKPGNQQQERDQAAANAKQTQLNEDRAAAQRQQGINIEGARLNFERQKEANVNGTSPEGMQLVDEIGTGKMAVDRLAYLLARNPALMSAVAQKYPDFDSSKVGAYIQATKDFTSSKPNTAGGSLLAGSVAFKHLQELKDMNTLESMNPLTAAYTAYQNKADTVSGELARFYQTDTLPGIASIKSTLASPLVYKRNAAITTQAQSMGDRLNSYEQTWKNAAPSAAYEAKMPGIDADAMKARAALDPNYKMPTSGGGGNTVVAPNGKTYNFPDAASAAKFKAAAGIQ
jgi:hypothetical protein